MKANNLASANATKIHSIENMCSSSILNPSGKDHSSFEVNFTSIKNEISRLYAPNKFKLPLVPAELYKLGSSGSFLVLSPNKTAAYVDLLDRNAAASIVDFSSLCQYDIKNMVIYNENEIIVADYWFNLLRISLNTVTLVKSYEIHSHAISVIIVSNDRESIFTLSSDSTLKRTNISTGNSVRLCGYQETPSIMGISPDESFLVVGDLKHTLHVFDIQENQTINTLTTVNEPVSIKISIQGQIFCAHGHLISAWDYGSWDLVAEFDGDSGVYTSMALNDSNTLLAASRNDGSIHIWNLRDFQVSAIKSLGMGILIHKVYFIGDETVYFFSNENLTAMVWDIPTVFSESSIHLLSSQSVKNLFYIEEKEYVIANIENGGCEVWDLKSNKRIKHLLDRHNGAITLSEDQNNVIGIFNKPEKYHIVMFKMNLSDLVCKEEHLVNYVDNWWATDIVTIRNRPNNCITLSCANGTVDVREKFGWVSIKSDWPLTNSIITCVLGFYSGYSLIIGIDDGGVKVFNLDSYTNEGTIAKHDSPISALAISEDDLILISGSEQGVIKISYLQTMTTLNTIKFYTQRITNLYVSKSNLHLMATSPDRGLTIWDLRTWTLCVLKPDFYNFSVTKNEKKIIIVSKTTWKIIENPLLGSTTSVFGPGSDESIYYKYLYDIMRQKNPEYNPSFDNWIVSSNLYTTAHFYAYYHLPNHLKKALDNKVLFVQTIDELSPLSICLEYRAFVTNDIIVYLLSRMKKNQGFSYFLRGNLSKLNEFGSEHLSDLYHSLFVRSYNPQLPDFCGKAVILPIIREIHDPLGVSQEDFLPGSIEGDIPQPIVFFQFLVPLCLALGSSESISFLRSLLNCSHNELFRVDFIGLILDYKWKQVRWIMRILAITYYAYLVLLIVYISNSLEILYWYPLIILSSLLSLYEIFQLVAFPALYFRETLNYVDVIRGLLFYLYTFFLVYSVDDNYMSSTLVALTLFSFIRGISYFSIFSATRYMVFLIYEVWKDMLAFIILLLYSTIAITITFMSIDSNQDKGNFYDYLLISYRIDLGDFDTDQYNDLETVLFVGGSLMNTIIMLNLLISIMSDTFDRIQQGTVEADRETLTGLILELEQLMFWNRAKSDQKYLFVCRFDDADLAGSRASWEGKVRAILEKLDRNRKQIDSGNSAMQKKLKKLDENFNLRLDRFEAEFQKFKQEILNFK